MSTRGCILLTVCLLSSGCRQDPYMDSYLESLRAEKLWLEDKIYDLEYMNQEQEAELQASRSENRQFREQLGLDIDSKRGLRQAQRSGREDQISVESHLEEHQDDDRGHFAEGPYPGERYGGDPFAGDQYEGDRYASDQYASDQYADDQYADDQYADDQYADDQYADDQYADDQYAGDQHARYELAGYEHGGEEYRAERLYEDEYYEDESGRLYRYEPAVDQEVSDTLPPEMSVLIGSSEQAGYDSPIYEDHAEYSESHFEQDQGEFGYNSLRHEEPADSRVTHIVLNPSLTSGHDFDQQVGDDGISIVFQPRNADDQFVAASGATSIVVVDPAIEGEQARVARWDFDEEEISYRLKMRTTNNRGIHLKLPWPNEPPTHSKLHLFVRFVTKDNRELETDTQLFVALPGQFSGRWTPKSRSSVAAESKPETGRDRSVLRKTTQGQRKAEANQRASAVVPATVTSEKATSEKATSEKATSDKLSETVTSQLRPTPATRAKDTVESQPAKSTAPSRRPVWSPHR